MADIILFDVSLSLNCTDSYKYGDDPKYWAEVFEHTLCIQIMLLRVYAIFCSAVSNNKLFY